MAKKQAQMEMMGLIMIVIILSFMLVFGMIYLKSNTQNNELPDQSFGEKAFADAFVSVLADTYVDACNADYSTLVKDCVTDQNIPCDSCHYVKIVAEKVLAETLDLWGENYRFRVLGSDPYVDPFVSINNTEYEDEQECDDDAAKEAPGIELIPLFPQPGHAQIVFEICKN